MASAARCATSPTARPPAAAEAFAAEFPDAPRAMAPSVAA